METEKLNEESQNMNDESEKMIDESEKIVEEPEKMNVEMEETPEDLPDQTDEILQALQTALDPMSTPENRLASYNFIEKIKSSVKPMMKYGYDLCKINYDPSVRHFGLQLIEDVIKLHWNDLSVQDKIFIKDEAMNLMKTGTLPILKENMHVKDQVAKLIVEMMKREWPQNWSSLLHDLTNIASGGSTYAELVLLVLLRTSEDVSTLKNFKDSRRQDMLRSLNYNMNSIFKFFFNLLEEHYMMYVESVVGSEVQAEHCRVVQMVFETLNSFLEWSNPNTIQTYNKQLFICITKLIVDKRLSWVVADCLLQLAQRREKVNDKYFALSLFHRDILTAIISAAQLFSTAPVNEEDYRVIKYLSQVLATLGSHLASLWSRERNLREPEEFSLYLEALLAFTRHPSYAIYIHTKSVWLHMFKTKEIIESISFKAVVPQWIQNCFAKCARHGYPSDANDPSSEYSRLDFDSDDEYQIAFSSTRSETIECLKIAVTINPQVYFALLKYNLKLLLNEQINFRDNNRIIALHSKWEAFAQVSGNVLPKIFDVHDYEVCVSEGVEMLRAVCTYDAKDPLVQTAVLDSIIGLSCFLPNEPSLAQVIVDRILVAVAFRNSDEGFHKMPRSVRNLRKTSASYLIRIFKRYPKEFVPIYDNVSAQFDELISAGDKITNLEKVLLEQARITLAKNLTDLELHTEILGKVILPIKDRWIELRNNLGTPLDLINFLGINDETEDDEESPYTENRKFISLSLGLIHAVIKYADISEAETQWTQKFTTLSKKVVMEHIFPLMQTTYAFCRAYHGLWSPEGQEHLTEFGRQALELSNKEIKNILGTNKSFELSQPFKKLPEPSKLERTKGYLYNIYDTLCTNLGTLANLCGSHFYEMPHLADFTIRSPLYNIAALPDSRLKHLLKNLLRPFCENCPADYNETVLLPVLHNLCPAMVDVLNNRSENLDQLVQEMSSTDDDVADEKVILKEMLIRFTMREYIDLLKSLIIFTPKHQTRKNDSENHRDNDYKENNDMEMDDRSPFRDSHKGYRENPAVRISQVGKLVLGVASICHPVVQSFTVCLTCRDSVCLRRSLDPIYVILKALIDDYPQYLSDEAIGQLLTMILKGMNIHGDDETTRLSLLETTSKVYTLIRPNFKSAREVLNNLPDVNLVELDKLDRVTLESNWKFRQQRISRIRKDALAAVVKPIIGVSVAEAFKNKIEIKDLPPILYADKLPKKNYRLDETTNGDMSLCALFDA